MFSRFIPLSACISLVLMLPFMVVYAQGYPLPAEIVANDILSGTVLEVKPANIEDGVSVWHVIADLDVDENPLPNPGIVAGLEFEDVTAIFDVGAVIIITNPANPISITNSELELSWSGIGKTELIQEEGESTAEFELRLAEYEQNYILTNFGGFGTLDGSALDVVVDNSTITFTIAADEPEGVWYIDGYNIHIAEYGAAVNIDKGIVIARYIDDIVGGVSSGGGLTKTGDGTLIIGGAWHDEDDGHPETGLNITGTLTLEGGTIMLAGDRELAAGEREAEGSATTEHYAGNVVIEGGTTLDINTGAMLYLTGSEVYDIEIQEGGTLRVATQSDAECYDTGIVNIEKYMLGEQTNILVDGGTVEIYKGNGNHNRLDAFSIDTEIGAKGGTIYVEDGITFESGAVTGTGNYVKIGEGTHIINGIDIEGSLVVQGGTTVLNGTSGLQKTSGIVIGNAEEIPETIPAVLDLQGGVLLALTGEEEYDIIILKGGTLRVATVVNEAENPAMFKADSLGYFVTYKTNIFVDGGKVDIYWDGGDYLDANSIDTAIGTEGGIINVETGITFISGAITSDVNGNVTKTGGGTHIVGTVNLGNGVYEVKQGTVEFTGSVAVGTLKNSVGTTIDMTSSTAPNFEFGNFEIAGAYLGGGRDLSVGTGTITGTMTDVGNLVVYNSFDLDSGEHSVENFVVNTSAVFDLKAGAMLQMTNDLEGNDIVVKGTLRVASAENTDIFKKDAAENSIVTNLFLDGGTVEIYKPTNGIDFLYAGNIDTTLGTQGGQFIVANGITFESGLIIGDTNGQYKKIGEGTHVVNGFCMDGDIFVIGGTTALYTTIETQNAGNVFVQNGATFEVTDSVVLELTGMMSIQDGGTITNAGTITTGTLNIASGGTLQLQATPKELVGWEGTMPSMISTEQLILGNGAKIQVSNYENQLGTYTYENLIEVTGSEGVTDAHLATLNGVKTALYRSGWERTTTESGHDALSLTLRLLNVKDYVNEIGWKHGNVFTVAGLIDRYVDKHDPSSGGGLIVPTTASLTSVNEIRDMLLGLSGTVLENDIRSAMAGELVGNAARMVMNSPYRTVFQRLDAIAPYGGTIRGQAQSNNRLRLWFNPYAQSEKGKSDDYTFDGYTLTRVGFMVGGDAHITSQSVAGMVLNYGNPNVKNDLGKVTANDFMIGVYAKLPVFWQITANAMIGYGIQRYTYKGPGGESDFNGDSIFGSLEFTRSFPMSSVIKLTPFVGLDFQSIGMDGLNVKSSLGNLPINPDGLDSVALRLGLRGECMRVRTRVQYMRQIGGDDYMMSAISLDSATSANVRSVQWGKDWVNVGLGGDVVQLQNFRVFVDYDFDVSKNTTSHLGSIGTVVMW